MSYDAPTPESRRLDRLMMLATPMVSLPIPTRIIKHAEPAWMARTNNQRKARKMRRQRHAAGDRHAFA